MKSCSFCLRITLFFILLSSFVHGQEIKIVDAVTLQPIPDVVIINLTKSAFVQTDTRGIAKLVDFSVSDQLEFQHPSYRNIVLSYSDVIEAGLVRLNEELIQIEEIVIRGTKWEQSGDVAQSIVKISPSDVQFYNPQTSADMLASTGQVFVQKSQLGGGSPMIRGFAANSVIIAVNGIRMNNAIFRSGNLQNIINIDPNVLEKADVVLGPGSVIYGSDALGGVMNFQVKKPQFSTTSSPLIKSTALLRYSSANNEQTGHIHFNLGGKRLSWLSSITFSNYDDLVTGEKRTEKYPDYGRRFQYVIPNGVQDVLASNANSNAQIYSGFHSINTIQRFKYRIGNTIDISYDFFYSTTSDIPRYDRLLEPDTTQNGLKYAIWKYGPQEWMMNSLRLESFSANAFYEEMQLVITNQRFEESRFTRRFQEADLISRNEKVNAWIVNLDFEKEYGLNQQLVYGLEGVYNGVTSSAISKNVETTSITPASTRYPDGGSDVGSFAFYGNYQRQLKQNLLFSVGARYHHFFLESRFIDTTFYNFPYNKITLNKGAVTGNISLAYSTSNSWKFDVMISSGFRAPNVDDIGKVFDSEPGNVVVPNENLAPEYIYNGELTVTKTIQGKFEIGINGFYSILRDAMVRRNFNVNGQDSIIYDGELSRVQALVNTGRATIAGLSSYLQLNFMNHFSLYSSFTLMNGKDTGENIPLRHTTPAFGKTSITYRQNQFRAEFNVQYQASRAFEDLAPSEQNKTHLYTPDGALGWSTLNINVSYQPNPLFQINGAIENLADIHYRPYSSGISAPGRNFIFSIRISI